MEPRIAKIVSDLELFLKAYPKTTSKERRDTMEIAYAYRLGQLENYGEQRMYEQYQQHFIRMTEHK